MFAGGMWAFYLEAVLALCLLAFIVWWTLPKQPPKSPSTPELSDAPSDNAVLRADKDGNSDVSADGNAHESAGNKEPGDKKRGSN